MPLSRLDIYHIVSDCASVVGSKYRLVVVAVLSFGVGCRGACVHDFVP